MIKGEINEKNVSAFYSQAYVMKCQKLMGFLDDLIVNELLTPANCTQFYLDSIRFETKKVSNACEQLMQQNFDEIASSASGAAFLLSLPYSQMKSLCASNSLNIKDEYILVDLFERYLAHRDHLPKLAEEERKLDDFKDLLTKEEIEARNKLKEEEEAAAKAKQEEEAKKKEEEYKALDPWQRFNRHYEEIVAKTHTHIQDRLKLQRLSKAERTELFKTIRFSFIKHEDLLHLLTLPRFELAKDLIAQGLSVRLNPYENAIKSELKINTEPRTYFEPEKAALGENNSTPAALFKQLAKDGN